MIIDDATQLIGCDVPKEVAVREMLNADGRRSLRAFAAVPTLPRRGAASAGAATFATPAGMLAAPYAHAPVMAPAQISWRAQLARHWLQWHLGLGVLTLAVGAMLIAAALTQVVGIALIACSCITLALVAIAMIFARYDAPTGAAVLALTADLVAILFGVALIGPRLETLVLLPGALLVTALLVDNLVIVVAGGVLGILAYGVAAVMTQLGVLRAIVFVDNGVMRLLDVAFAVVGLTLLLVAITLVVTQLRRALSGEAATDHRLQVLERRTQAKRAVIDADAIALQTEIARTLRGATPRQITTCEDLAPLSTMLNAMTTRVPGLLADREERLRLEKAIRDLATALETAWAGFEWTWPAPTGTTVDRLVTILRPTPLPSTTQ